MVTWADNPGCLNDIEIACRKTSIIGFSQGPATIDRMRALYALSFCLPLWPRFQASLKPNPIQLWP
jgi:hypothetical protein